MFSRHKKVLLLLIIIGAFWGGQNISAREYVTDWYIKDFQTEIVVNKDSSLLITEKITADCGNASGKHGIFRILPEKVKITGGKEIKMPVKLISITDFSGTPLKYDQKRNYSDDTVTWKIGDPNKAVQGVNEYEIKYHVANTIRSGNEDFDEFYWNLNGNFWDLETDNFQARIIFPEGITKNNAQVEYYTGPLGSRYKNQADFRWISDNVLEFSSIGILRERDGITASVIFPKNIITPHAPGFFEAYGKYLWLILPVTVMIFCFNHWRKYGKDPKVDKTVIAQYSPPGNLTPCEMGILDNGSYYDALTTAEIINLAVKGLLTIKETNNKILLFNIKDYEFTKKENKEEETRLIRAQKSILNAIFKEGDKANLSDLRSSFREVLDGIQDNATRSIEKKGLVVASGEKKMMAFAIPAALISIGTIIGFLIFKAYDDPLPLSGYFFLSLLISGIIGIIFGILMRKRTLAGAELAWEIKGFKLFMETVDKDRAKFYEKENIFEKLLPYAIAFEMTEEWINRMKAIYGEDFAKHAPAWYIAAGSGSFDPDNFTKSISSLSASISQNTSSSSGSGGGGSSGGGGGGGGGGGW